MMKDREDTPKCSKCGEVIAVGIYKENEKQEMIFSHWEYFAHFCPQGKKLVVSLPNKI